jgi:hypothetical protein
MVWEEAVVFEGGCVRELAVMTRLPSFAEQSKQT